MEAASTSPTTVQQKLNTTAPTTAFLAAWESTRGGHRTLRARRANTPSTRILWASRRARIVRRGSTSVPVLCKFRFLFFPTLPTLPFSLSLSPLSDAPTPAPSAFFTARWLSVSVVPIVWFQPSSSPLLLNFPPTPFNPFFCVSGINPFLSSPSPPVVSFLILLFLHFLFLALTPFSFFSPLSLPFSSFLFSLCLSLSLSSPFLFFFFSIISPLLLLSSPLFFFLPFPLSLPLPLPSFLPSFLPSSLPSLFPPFLTTLHSFLRLFLTSFLLLLRFLQYRPRLRRRLRHLPCRPVFHRKQLGTVGVLCVWHREVPPRRRRFPRRGGRLFSLSLGNVHLSVGHR